MLPYASLIITNFGFIHTKRYNRPMMEIDMDKRHWEHGPCPKHDCRKDGCKCGLRLITLPAALGDDSKDSPVAPKNGDYCNAIVKYEANNHLYIYSSEGVPTLIYDGNSGCECDSNIVVGLENGMTTYPVGTAPISFDDALAAFQNGQSIFLIDHAAAMDEVYTVSAIEAIDGIWSMKVERVGMHLQSDEGFWVVKAYNPTEWRSVTFFKSVIDPATETQVEAVDSKIGDLEDLQTTDKDNVVDAINEIVSGGGGGGPTVVQTPGVSTTSVMSQNAATKMVYQVLEGNFPSVVSGAVQIDPTYAGAPSQVTDNDYGDVIMIGRGALPIGSGSCRSIQIGAESQSSFNGIALGFKAIETNGEGVALGAFSKTGASNVVSVGNSSATTYVDIDGQTVTVPAFTRRITHVSTPVDSDDAATKGYVDAATGKNVFYGTCNTAGGVSAKEVACSDFTEDDLTEGTILFVKFAYYSSGNFPTLNVNNTGAVATTVAANMWSNNETVAFVYSSDTWNMIESGLATTSIYGITKLHNSSTSSTTAMALVPAALNNVLTTMVAGASPYSATATYAVGDYCRYGDNIYRCNTAIVGGETWNASHWDLMPSLQDQLDNTETWTFELDGGTTVTKKVVVR